MLEKLDRLFFRFEEAFSSFVDPDRTNQSFNEGKYWGKQVAFAQVRQGLDRHDPYEFENNHFKMGYYYAYEQAKKVMPNDNEDTSLD